MRSAIALLLMALSGGQAFAGAQLLSIAVVAGPDRPTLSEPLAPWVDAVREAVRLSPEYRLVEDPAKADTVVRVEDRYDPGDSRVLAGNVLHKGTTEPFKVHFKAQATKAEVASALVKTTLPKMLRQGQDRGTKQ